MLETDGILSDRVSIISIVASKQVSQVEQCSKETNGCGTKLRNPKHKVRKSLHILVLI